VVTSAGALIDGLAALRAKRVAIVAPYMKPLTQLVVSYIESEGFAVQDWLALEIPDNLEVAAQDPAKLLTHYRKLDLSGIDALVLSACVQMPSLVSIQKVEDEIGLPVVSAAVCTTHQMLKRLQLETRVPDAGALLSGKY
jgi:maleate isomerase